MQIGIYSTELSMESIAHFQLNASNFKYNHIYKYVQMNIVDVLKGWDLSCFVIFFHCHLPC